MTRRHHLLLLATTALMPLGTWLAVANPLTPTVVSGTATVTGQNTSTVTVTQTTQNAIINWNTFNIANGETTNIYMPNASSVGLERVTGNLGPSTIMGNLWSNGILFLVNPNGILFGQGAQVNVGGLLATTHDISNSNFMAGKYNFNITGNPSASIVNLGTITAAQGGFAALVAPGVRNSGTITATLGTVGLAASGKGFTLDMYGDNLITLAVGDNVANQVKDVATGLTLTSLVTNTGTLSANGGKVQLTAAAAKTVIDSVINTSGTIEANAIADKGGTITLTAATGQSTAQNVKISGTLSAAGKKAGQTGGTITVTGQNIALTGAKIDASGMAGGGTVQIGSKSSSGSSGSAGGLGGNGQMTTTVTADAATTINASAIQNGNGGTVSIWSNATTFAGQILATGGALGGNGGYVETSGNTVNLAGIRVDTSAPFGKTGMWLIDPANITIDASFASLIMSELANTNVTIQTSGEGSGNGDIIVNSAISWTGATALTLDAYRDITVNAAITLSNGTLNLNAGNAIAINSLVNVTQGGAVNLTAATGTYGQTLLSFGSGGSVQFTGSSDGNQSLSINDQNYTLLYNINQLQNDINENLSGNYALATSISAASIANWAPLGDFNGRFEGLGNAIDKLTIAPTDPNIQSIGLFSMIGVGGMVSDLNLTNASITANPNYTGPGQFIGVLAGQNAGLVSNVTATGQINGLTLAGVIAGGLVGQNGVFGPNAGLGTIVGSSANVAVTLGNGISCNSECNGGYNYAGGLVGNNPGIIANSSASGSITVGSFADGGGLVGSNGNFNGSTPLAGAVILGSFATGAVNSAGVNISLGGLVGQNQPLSYINNSYATGNVTATAAVTRNNNNCSNSNDCQYVSVGGLVGQNSGTIAGTPWEGAPTSATLCGAGFTCASGTVTVGSQGTAGGLVGDNTGIIQYAYATGNVIGAAGIASTTAGRQFDNNTTLGGLVGTNEGLVTNTFATGNVGSSGVAYLEVGGLVGDNSGMISSSFAYGTVSAGFNSVAGGLAANNSPDYSICTGCFVGDGYQYLNVATIANSGATGNVTVGASSVAGGLVGAVSGTITNGFASGSVSSGANSAVGGLVGALDVGGYISGSAAANTVASTGPNSVVGGLVGVSGGTITNSTFTGTVSGGPDSFIGGLVGANFGTVLSSTVIESTITGTGANDIIGGLAGLNIGSLTDSAAQQIAIVSSGSGSIVGGIAGVNGTYVFTGPDPFLTDPSAAVAPTTTSQTGTYAGSTATGTGFPSLIGATTPSSVPQFPSWVSNCNAALCTGINNGTLQITPAVSPPPPPPPPPLPPPPITQQIATVTTTTTNSDQNNVITPINLGPTGGTGGTGSRGGTGGSGGTTGSAGTTGSQGHVGGNGAPPGVRLIDMPVMPLPPGSGLPPPGETRFLSNEVVLQIGNASQQQIDELAGRFGLSVGACDRIGMLSRTACNFRITDGRPVRDVIRAIEATKLKVWTGPVYTYGLAQEPASIPRDADADTNMGDPAQYVIGKFQLAESHRLTRGDNVIVAVIDSEIDASHPDLAGVVTNRYDAGCGATAPDSHGTGMTGAIAAHRNLMGVAPNVKVIAICAFGGDAASAESTSMKIIKGLDYAISQGARVINMSFAGPRDPALAQALQIAREKGVTLIGAAGNAGPKSPPLYPGADPNVIAVTATDDHDRLFNRANQGKYIAVAAPGVDILVPAPNGGVQLTTGTSVATAHVSGVAALLVAQNPKRTPDDIRNILTATAKDLGPKGVDPQFGAGLVDPLKALRIAPPAMSHAPPPVSQKSAMLTPPGMGR